MHINDLPVNNVSTTKTGTITSNHSSTIKRIASIASNVAGTYLIIGEVNISTNAPTEVCNVRIRISDKEVSRARTFAAEGGGCFAVSVQNLSADTDVNIVTYDEYGNNAVVSGTISLIRLV